MQYSIICGQSSRSFMHEREREIRFSLGSPQERNRGERERRSSLFRLNLFDTLSLQSLSSQTQQPSTTRTDQTGRETKEWRKEEEIKNSTATMKTCGKLKRSLMGYTMEILTSGISCWLVRVCSDSARESFLGLSPCIVRRAPS